MITAIFGTYTVSAETANADAPADAYAEAAEDVLPTEPPHEESDKDNSVFVKSWRYVSSHCAEVTVKNTTAENKTVRVALAQYDPEKTENTIPAFPGAEGGGKYTKGARGVLDNAASLDDSMLTVTKIETIELAGGAEQQINFVKLDQNAAKIFLWDENNAPYGEPFTLPAEPAPSTIEVYHVTSLASEGEGTLRDALSREGRIIVFDVGGVIELPDTLYITKNNITILGQTAPGDGITLTGGDLRIGNGIKNVIIRYIRVRPTDDTGNEVDGLGGQWNTDVIIDHCSASWCIDECLTLYAGSAEDSKYAQAKRLTVQNTISSESLRMSNHFKGAHGYGGILGGTNATYWRNLFAHHDSRSPRLDRCLDKTDFRNNIVYNWGVTNSAYGAEPTSPHNRVTTGTKVNYSNNYYKFGPSTVAGKRYRLFDFAKMAKTVNGVTYKSKFYLNDNYVFGSSTVTSNNWHNDGVNKAQDQVEKVEAPFSLGDSVYSDLNIPSGKLLAGKDCLEILNDVGATLPKRDNIDARVIADVVNQTGRVLNKDEEVGAFTGISSSERKFEIPQDWKAANNMDASAKDEDIIPSGVWAGYTWIEAYVNDWTAQQAAPTNPSVTVTSPAIAAMNGTNNKSKWAVIKDNAALSYKASATPANGTTITKMELYDEENLIKAYDGAASIDDSIILEPGTHYLTCLAYNDKGESTRSDTSIVYVNGSTKPEGWSHKQIGTPTYAGLGAISYDAENDSYMIGGSGKIAGDTKYFDICDFMYKEVTGDFDISLKIDELPKNENGPAFGLMLRETLDSKSRMASIVDGWIKYGRNNRIVARTETGKGIYVDPNQTNSTDNKMGAFMSGRGGEIVSGNVLGEHPYEAYHPVNYLRIQRSGDTIKLSVSDGGTDYTDNDRQPYTLTINNLSNKLYVGVVIDSQMNQSDASPQLYYSQARFSELSLKNEAGFDPGETPSPAPTPNETLTDYPDWKVGQAGADKTDGAAVQIEWEGKTAVRIDSRNIYKTLDAPISSGTATFNTDVYLNPTTDKSGFRIYLENDKALNYQDGENTLGGVIAEVVCTDSGSFNIGPDSAKAGTKTPVYNFADEKAGWFNVNISIDYSKESTAVDFISLTVKNSDGTVVADEKMPAIAGIDPSLKQIRLIARSIQPYFANMTLRTAS